MAMRATNGWGNHGQYERQAREFICDHCGEAFQTKATKARDCPKCRVIARREYSEEMLARQRAETQAKASLKYWNSYRYEVLFDPDECTGLSRGARFADSDMNCTLFFGHLTPGTRLLDRKAGVEMVVIGRPFQKQALVPVAREAGAGA